MEESGMFLRLAVYSISWKTITTFYNLQLPSLCIIIGCVSPLKNKPLTILTGFVHPYRRIHLSVCLLEGSWTLVGQ